jgi:hypothetical protein
MSLKCKPPLWSVLFFQQVLSLLKEIFCSVNLTNSAKLSENFTNFSISQDWWGEKKMDDSWLALPIPCTNVVEYARQKFCKYINTSDKWIIQNNKHVTNRKLLTKNQGFLLNLVALEPNG